MSLPLNKLPTYTSLARNDEFFRLFRVLTDLQKLDRLILLGAGVLEPFSTAGLQETRDIPVHSYDVDPDISRLIARVQAGKVVYIREVAEVSKDRMRDMPNWSLLSKKAIDKAKIKLQALDSRLEVGGEPPDHYLIVPPDIRSRVFHHTADVFTVLADEAWSQERLLFAGNLLINLERHFSEIEMGKLYQNISRCLQPHHGIFAFTSDYRHLDGSDNTCLPYAKTSILQRLEQRVGLFPVAGVTLHLFKWSAKFPWYNANCGVISVKDPTLLPFNAETLGTVIDGGLRSFFARHGLKGNLYRCEETCAGFYEHLGQTQEPVFGFVRPRPDQVIFWKCEGSLATSKTNDRDLLYFANVTRV